MTCVLQSRKHDLQYISSFYNTIGKKNIKGLR